MSRTIYVYIAVFAGLMLITAFLHIHENGFIGKYTKIKFYKVIAISNFTLIIDTTFRCFEGNYIIKDTILYSLKCLEFCCKPLIDVFILSIFIDNVQNNNSDNTAKRICRIRNFLIALFIVNSIMQVLSVNTTQFVFSISNKKYYHRESLAYVYAIFIAICTLLMLYGIILYANSKQKSNILTVLGICVVYCVGFSIKINNQNTNFDWLSIAIGEIFIMIYYFDIILKHDSLTQLLNRKVYDTFIQTIDYTTLVVMIDVNYFKIINDTYGHAAGDNTLKQIADSIVETYGKYGYCFRIGGDEFCVVLRNGMFNSLVKETPNYDVYAMAEGLMKALDSTISEKDKANSKICLKYGVSQGYGVYYLPSEHPNMRTILTLENVLKLADKRMYKRKEAFKKELGDDILINNVKEKVIYQETKLEVLSEDEEE